MNFRLLLSFLVCPSVVQSQLPRKEWENDWFFRNSTVTNKTEDKKPTKSDVTTPQPTKSELKNENIAKQYTTTPDQISKSTIVSTLLRKTRPTISVTVPPSILQHKNLPAKYSSMSFSDFITMSGIGEKSITALLRKYLFSLLTFLFKSFIFYF